MTLVLKLNSISSDIPFISPKMAAVNLILPVEEPESGKQLIWKKVMIMTIFLKELENWV